MNAEAVRAWLAARYDEDERRADGIHHESCESLPPPPGYNGPFPCGCGVPEQIRREIAAKRLRLERHAPCDSGTAGHPWCEWCTSNDEYEGWPCPDIIDDAQSYQDHADFPAELRLP